MIITLTVNPSLDRTIEVEHLVRGAVQRARASRLDPGGKGINVSRALAAAERRTRAVLPIGGSDGHELIRRLNAEGVDALAVPIAAATRSNVGVVEADGTTTKLNEVGASLSPAEIVALTNAVVGEAAGADWVVASGSLAPGLPTGYYADLVALLRRTNVRVAVDTSGPALPAAVGAGPALVKPNREELAEASGRAVRTIADAVEAARQLQDRGAHTVLVSLGADGALLVDGAQVSHGEAFVAEPRSTVGAGDALLAGFLCAGGQGHAALTAGLAWGAAAVALPGSRMPTPADLDLSAVRLHDRIDPTRPLKEEH